MCKLALHFHHILVCLQERRWGRGEGAERKEEGGKGGEKKREKEGRKEGEGGGEGEEEEALNQQAVQE